MDMKNWLLIAGVLVIGYYVGVKYPGLLKVPAAVTA